MNVEKFYKIFLSARKIQIDSRLVQQGDLFFAFTSERFNAATLADKAIKAGAKAVIVEDRQFEDPENSVFYVESTLLFLQNLAVHHRKNIYITVIGLTGSNGKTTTKELLHAVLSSQFKILSTHGNLNNHIGVPLTILSITEKHEIAIVEMGANHQKEIEFLCEIAKPTFGYITNFGKAHLEGFGGIEGVIKGKSELYNYLQYADGTILVNDADLLQVEKTRNYLKIVSFGAENSTYNFEICQDKNYVGLQFRDQQLMSQLTGAYNFSNISAAVAVGLHYQIPFPAIAKSIQGYSPNNMRSQIVEKDGRTLVLDTYNANPSSMLESLQNFDNFDGSKTVIIGDMLELGNESAAEHRRILALAENLQFDTIITVGELFYQENKSFSKFMSTKELILYLQTEKITTDNILLKASRGIALEKIINHL